MALTLLSLISSLTLLLICFRVAGGGVSHIFVYHKRPFYQKRRNISLLLLCIIACVKREATYIISSPHAREAKVMKIMKNMAEKMLDGNI